MTLWVQNLIYIDVRAYYVFKCVYYYNNLLIISMNLAHNSYADTCMIMTIAMDNIIIPYNNNIMYTIIGPPPCSCYEILCINIGGGPILNITPCILMRLKLIHMTRSAQERIMRSAPYPSTWLSLHTMFFLITCLY